MRYLLFIFILLVIGSCNRSTTEQNNAAQDSLVTEESEEAEFARRAEEEEKAYSEMNAYDGTYQLYTESEGAEGTLTLKYLGDKTFAFLLQLMVNGKCKGIVQDTAYADRTQHAFYQTDGCLLHFELLGQNIEINADEGCDKMKGECSFTGVYQSMAMPN